MELRVQAAAGNAARGAADSGRTRRTGRAHPHAPASSPCASCLDVAYLFTLSRKVVTDSGRGAEAALTALERDILAYAEAVTATPPTVTDELSERLLLGLGPAALVELTVFIGLAHASGCVPEQ